MGGVLFNRGKKTPYFQITHLVENLVLLLPVKDNSCNKLVLCGALSKTLL